MQRTVQWQFLVVLTTTKQLKETIPFGNLEKSCPISVKEIDGDGSSDVML